MTLVLMAVGLLVTAAGLLTVGFGIPINAFSLGNTLIIAGTIAVSGGLILIALALVHGQLRRIAETLKGKALARSPEVAAMPVAPRLSPEPPIQPPLADLPTVEPPRLPDLPQISEPAYVPSCGSPLLQASLLLARWIGCAQNPSRSPRPCHL